MKTNKRHIIITTFREDLNFDDNFYNLLEEKDILEKEHNIKSEIVAGKYKGIVEYSLLILAEFNQIVHIKVRAKKIMVKYFQECFLDIINEDVYFINEGGLVLDHFTWLKVSRQEAIKNGDFTYHIDKDEFYIAK